MKVKLFIPGYQKRKEKDMKELENFSIEDLEAEIERRRMEAEKGLKEAMKTIEEAVVKNMPSYIRNSQHAANVEDVTYQLGCFVNNWTNAEAWQYSDIC